MALKGGCRCQACRYVLDYPAIPVVYACHCLDCQTMSGAAFTLQALIRSERFLIDGEVVEWTHQNSQGKVTIQRFCTICKTRLYSTNEGRPGLTLVRAGTLDVSSEVIPAVHIWTKRKQPWIQLPVDAAAYDEGIEPARAATIFAPNFN